MGIHLSARCWVSSKPPAPPPMRLPRRRSPILSNTRTPRSSPASPAWGCLAGARVLAEIGDDRSRFADARGLKAFAGSAPDHPRQRQENRCPASTYQEPTTGRRRPDLGPGIAARLARGTPTLRRPPRRRRLEPPSPTTPVQQVPRSTSPLPSHRPELQRTRGVPTSFPARGLTFNFVRCLSGGDQVGQAQGVHVGAAEHQLGSLGPPDVQMCVVLPGETDAAVNAHVVQRCMQEGLRASHLGHRGGDREFTAVGGFRSVKHLKRRAPLPTWRLRRGPACPRSGA